MGAPTKYGKQPAAEVIRKNGAKQTALAQEMDISYTHLVRVLLGIVRPCNEIREFLPGLLDTPLDELFTAEILEKPHRPHHPANSGYLSQADIRARRAQRLQDADKS